MSDTTEPKSDFQTLAQLVNTSFPDLYCLRCGNEQFFVTDDPATANLREVRTLLGMPAASDAGLGPVVTLACRRCGFVEQHLTDPASAGQETFAPGPQTFVQGVIQWPTLFFFPGDREDNQAAGIRRDPCWNREWPDLKTI